MDSAFGCLVLLLAGEAVCACAINSFFNHARWTCYHTVVFVVVVAAALGICAGYCLGLNAHSTSRLCVNLDSYCTLWLDVTWFSAAQSFIEVLTDTIFAESNSSLALNDLDDELRSLRNTLWQVSNEATEMRGRATQIKSDGKTCAKQNNDVSIAVAAVEESNTVFRQATLLEHEASVISQQVTATEARRKVVHQRVAWVRLNACFGMIKGMAWRLVDLRLFCAFGLLL